MQQKLNRSTLVNDFFMYLYIWWEGGMIRIILLLHKAYTKLKRINCWYDEELLTYLSNMLGTIKRMEELNENKTKLIQNRKF